ncbi:hypothetical protein EOD39_13841 [Acipenser ruthenus]|uniref:Uncharacterized protein n=1 Tax=Acipenser ruthenus TaxID=7906 RepID=A0A662YPL1_ACIRT|nr:hypothetical protein EOD39_13841 [Acipenser ruthenus]
MDQILGHRPIVVSTHSNIDTSRDEPDQGDGETGQNIPFPDDDDNTIGSLFVEMENEEVEISMPDLDARTSSPGDSLDAMGVSSGHCPQESDSSGSNVGVDQSAKKNPTKLWFKPLCYSV